MSLLDILSKAGDYIVSEGAKNAERVNPEAARRMRERMQSDSSSRSNGSYGSRDTGSSRGSYSSGGSGPRKRTTDEEYSKKSAPPGKKPRDYQYRERVPLKEAMRVANGEPGVYVLFLGNKAMKCGRAAFSQGVKWRLTQYYNLNYDGRAQKGDYWSITPANRDEIYVSWQCCPAMVCEEMEYKLFNKYGKGPWALRAPSRSLTNKWELLI